MNNVYIRILINVTLFMVLQVILVRNLVLFDTAFAFIYLTPLLIIPVDFNKVSLLVIAFVLGLTMDIFYDTLGIHAASCVLLAFARPLVIDILTPRMGYDNNEQASWQAHGFVWFTAYSIILTFLHHQLLFFLYAFSFQAFWSTFSKGLSSTVYTLVLILLTQLTSLKAGQKR